MNLEDLLPAQDVRIGHNDLTVEAARPQQRRIQNVGTVGGGDQDDALIGLEPVHFHQQLIERLFALVIAAAKPGAAMASNGIDFIDENDAGRVLLALFEHIADAAGADADEHLDEVGTGNGEERYIRFAGDGARQQRFAGARRPDQ